MILKIFDEILMDLEVFSMFPQPDSLDETQLLSSDEFNADQHHSLRSGNDEKFPA